MKVTRIACSNNSFHAKQLARFGFLVLVFVWIPYSLDPFNHKEIGGSVLRS